MQLHARGDFLWTSGSGEDQSPIKTDEPDAAEPLSATLASTTLDATSTPPPVASDPAPATASTDADLTPAQVDAVLRTALLLAIRTTLAKQASTLLPMPASSLYSSYVLPYRPAGSTLDLKRSSHKKLAGFVKSVAKEGILAAKEVKGEMLVMSVNAEHVE